MLQNVLPTCTILDRHFSTVEITGAGHILWRVSFFPNVARSFLQNVCGRRRQPNGRWRGLCRRDLHDSSQQLLTQAENVGVSNSIDRLQPLCESTPSFPRQEQIQPVRSEGQKIISTAD